MRLKGMHAHRASVTSRKVLSPLTVTKSRPTRYSGRAPGPVSYCPQFNRQPAASTGRGAEGGGARVARVPGLERRVRGQEGGPAVGPRGGGRGEGPPLSRASPPAEPSNRRIDVVSSLYNYQIGFIKACIPSLRLVSLL